MQLQFKGLYNEYNCLLKSIHAIERAIFLANSKLIRYNVQNTLQAVQYVIY
jgi:hypothetical protein